MGKKAKEKRKSEKIQAIQNDTRPSDGSGKPANDLYSQIFADTDTTDTDDEELVLEEKVSAETKTTKVKKSKKGTSQVILEQQSKPQDKKLSQAKAAKKGAPEKVMKKLKQLESDGDESEADDEVILPQAKATQKVVGLKKTGSLDVPEKVIRKLKQVESDNDESEADEVMYDDDEDEDEQDNMDLDEDNDEGGELESNQQTEEGQSDVEESEEEGEGDDAKTPLRSQLKDLSFIELEALKQKMGLKEYNEAMFGNKTAKKKGKKKKFERKNKNRPLEISSKRRVPKLREVVKVPRKVQKDPRFDNACGEYSETFWNTEYSFLRNLQKTEAEHLKKNLKTVNDNDKKREIRKFIQKVSDKEKSIVAKEKEAQKRLQDKQENKKRVEEGKRPFYVKKSTQKFMDLVEKYDELKSSGGLDKYLKKKRKKNAVRDRKSIKPFK